VIISVNRVTQYYTPTSAGVCRRRLSGNARRLAMPARPPARVWSTATSRRGCPRSPSIT
jgi:hypothetical protein